MKYTDSPWRLLPTKISRYYSGGQEIDRFRGISPALDDGRPEAWVGSVVSVKDAAAHGDPYEGRARCILPDDRECYLFEAIEEDTEGALGPKHLAIQGTSLGLLVKLLDPCRQLALQCHPSRAYAEKFFSSKYGKTECWYVLGLRGNVPDRQYVLLGFKENVTREHFERLYEMEDITGMEECCHKIEVQPGDVFFVGAGVPHTIGPNCFILEVQEPTDITLGVRKLDGNADEIQQALHKERTLGAYEYVGADEPTNLLRRKVEPVTLRAGQWGKETLLVGPRQTPYFSLTQMEVSSFAGVRHTEFAQICVILEGKGRLGWRGGEMAVSRADELFIPAGVRELSLVPEGDGVKAVFCHPQGVHFA